MLAEPRRRRLLDHVAALEQRRVELGLRPAACSGRRRTAPRARAARPAMPAEPVKPVSQVRRCAAGRQVLAAMLVGERQDQAVDAAARRAPGAGCASRSRDRRLARAAAAASSALSARRRRAARRASAARSGRARRRASKPARAPPARPRSARRPRPRAARRRSPRAERASSTFDAVLGHPAAAGMRDGRGRSGSAATWTAP